MEIKSVVLSEYSTVCYMLSGDDYAVVIDPAKFTSTVKEFANQNIDKKTKLILLTHCHYDHMGGAQELKSLWNAPVCIGEDDAQGLLNTMTNLSGRYSDRPISFEADKLLTDGEVIELGKDSLTVLKTPGHTIGSVCYITDGVMFSGDTLFKLTAGRCDFPTGDSKKLMESLAKLKAMHSDYRVLPGHGIETKLSVECVTNRYMKTL